MDEEDNGSVIFGKLDQKCSKCGKDIDGPLVPMCMELSNYKKYYCRECYEKFWIWLDKRFNEEVD